MRELPPLPEYGHAFSPRWHGDPGGFTVQQMHAHAAAARLAALEEAARLCELAGSTGDNKDCPQAVNGFWPDQVAYRCASAIRALAIHVPPTCTDSGEK